ncbi:MAG TPA: ABC transporter ATP-binding protein [Minicystis sp.]|nr:ABC transporter ATP-binding protein [Minicystis sp.]
MPSLKLAGVCKSFGGKACLDGLDLSVEEGMVFGFLGPNGAGKTTTIRIVLGLLVPERGDVEVLGMDPRKTPTAVRREIGALLDHDGHYDRLTALQNLAFHAGVRGIPDADARVRELLERCGLWERRRDRVSRFSKGMRQKLAVARALLHRPRLVLLDEPFTGLDPAAAVELRDDIRRLARDEGTTVLLTTHDLHHVERLCDEVAVLEKGRAVAAGAPASLRRRADGAHEIFAAGDGLTAGVLEAMAAAGALTAFELRGHGAVLRCDEGQRLGLGTELVRRGVRLEELTPRRATLEEAFLKIVGERA